MSKLKFLKNVEFEKAQSLFRKRKYSEAFSVVKRLLVKNKQDLNLLNLSGQICLGLQNYKRAHKYFISAFKIKEDNLLTLKNLGNLYFHCEDFYQAEINFKKFLEIYPDDIQVINQLARIYIKKKEPNIAKHLIKNNFSKIKFFEEQTFYNKAYLSRLEGDIKQTKIAYRNLIRLNPSNFKTVYNLINSEKKIPKYLIKIIKQKKNSLDAEQKIYRELSNGLISRGKKKVSLLINAHNNFYKLNKNFKLINKKIWALKDKVLNKKLLVSKDFKPCYDVKPIFIIGLPRTGSTILQKMLSLQNGSIYPLEEVMIFYKNIGFDYNLPKIINESFKNKILNDYIQIIGKKFDRSFTFIDKSLENFFYIDVIKLIFPHAKFIKCEREIDLVLFSILKNNLFQVSWAHRLQDIKKYILQYRLIIKYFTQKYPNSLLEFNHKKLINDKEREIKKISNECELKWNKNFLNKNYKVISETSSNLQVNQKVSQKFLRSKNQEITRLIKILKL